MTGGASKIIELRALLAEKFPSPSVRPGAHLATGIPALDAALGGGLSAGRIAEFFSPTATSGAGLMLRALLASVAEANQRLALIDGSDSFDPQPLGDAILRHLLWVRCHSATQAVKAADLLLRDGNLPLVVMDLRGTEEKQLRKIPSTTWYRFQRIAEQGTAAFLVLSPRALVSSADVRVKVGSRFALDALDLPLDRLLEDLRFEMVRMQSAADRREEVG